MKLSDLFEANHITRMDHSKPTPKDFSKSLNRYVHNHDWSQSGLAGDKPSYNAKVKKGLFGGSVKDSAPYAIPRHISWVHHFEPDTNKHVITIDDQHENEVRQARPVLSTWNKQNKFDILPSGERFSVDPGRPTSQKIIQNPIKHMNDHGYDVQFGNLKDHVAGLKSRGINYDFEGDLDHIDETIKYRSRMRDISERKMTTVAINPTKKEWDENFPDGAGAVLCKNGAIAVGNGPMLAHDEILNLAKIPQDQEKYRCQVGLHSAYIELWLFNDEWDINKPSDEEIHAFVLKRYGETIEQIEAQLKKAVLPFLGDVPVKAIPLNEDQEPMLPGDQEFIRMTFPR